MRTRLLAYLLLSLLLSLLPAWRGAYAQEPEQHPIDRSLDACIEKDPSTAGMVECIGRAYESWDKELNRAYNELSRKLSPQGRQALKAAQLEWIKYRDSEFKLIDSVYYGLQGTMYIPMRADSRLKIVKSRALELNDYLGLVGEHDK
ncbi:MAG TPA: lysozyme inhibitor LprI family protein [Blastocatellia bacterium]|nr:lysozyme inhibitor LprI family protein [Blastocatellia bacterium]